MPEGPEIRRAADKVAAAIANRETTAVFFAFEQLKPYEERLAGKRVTAVESKGKAMLIHFANDLTIYTHNQLYGKWIVSEAHDYPDTNRQLRLAIHNKACSALLYSASDIEVLRDGELDAHPFLSKLGPDVLNDPLTAEAVAARFMEERFRRRQLSTLLLDQGFLAGLGNYLRSEVLFAGRTHPTLRPIDCSETQINALATAVLTLAQQSYETGGITNDLQLVEQLRQQGVPRNQYRFRVFNREDKACYECGTPIVKERIGGRRCYLCPSCQAK